MADVDRKPNLRTRRLPLALAQPARDNRETALTARQCCFQYLQLRRVPRHDR